MSFSEQVRKEICTYITDRDRAFSCLYGMILFSRIVDRNQIYFQSKSPSSAETFGKLSEMIFRRKTECRQSQPRNDRILYTYDIKSRELLDMIFSAYRLTENERNINYEIISTSSLGMFMGGIFLACGSVNDPEKEYHLEFAVTDKTLADELIIFLADIGVNARSSMRRGQYIVYIKESESIEDTLTFIGAKNCTLDIINVKILKDIRNRVNRITNCDSANIDKIVAASLRQIDDISLIAEKRGLDTLPEELREAAMLRLENPSMSLKDIGENLSEPLSRSGVNHRFQRIAAIAGEIRKEGSE